MTPQLPETVRVLIISASDSKYFFLLQGLLESLRAITARQNTDVACFDLGLAPSDRAWLDARAIKTAVPGTHFDLDVDHHSVVQRSFLVRPFLSEYFPGYDIYFWIDSDIWLQDEIVFHHYTTTAMQLGFALAHEREKAYAIDPRLFVWSARHAILGCGVADGIRLVRHPQINAGIFAIAADAPHWQAWAEAYRRAIARTGRLAPYDQVALNKAVYGIARSTGTDAPPGVLAPEWNWICRRGVPMWNDTTGQYCKPYAPYDRLFALHLAGIGKHTEYTVQRTGGGSFRTMIVVGSSPDRPIRAAEFAA